MVLTHGAQGWYTAPDERLRVGLGLTGRWSAGRDAGFGESLLHHLTATLQGTSGDFQPGGVVHPPLEADHREAFTAVFGVTATVSLFQDSES